ncbi:MAG TPA: ABC transporter permease [Puia sp.]|nr:ABC transporter permease [Puia sp.]
MLKTWFKLAFRNLFINRFSSIINIGGLAVGMAVALLIGLWIYDELSFNKSYKNYDRIAQVLQSQVANGKRSVQATMPFPMGAELRNKYGSDFTHIVMTSYTGDHILATGEKKLTRIGTYMDKGAPAMLSLKMLKGSYHGLDAPNSILLAASTAKAVFGDADPVNKPLKIDNKLNVTVTGVYEDLPYNSEFKDLSFIAPWDLYITSENWLIYAKNNPQWDNNSFQIYVQLADNADLDAINKKIINVKQDKVAPQDKNLKTEVFLHPMRDWHLRSHWVDGKQSGGLIDYVWLFGIIGVFVLILACINFMNLSTARSERRAKEVGIRKAIGSLRSQLISQFYVESLLVAFFAFIVSLGAVQAILPWFNQLANKKMVIPWSAPLFWLTGLAFSFLTAIIAGSYPALYLSSFHPIKVLKGTFRVGRFSSIPRKVLVVLQFTISLALITATIIVYNQIQYSKNRPIGYDRTGLMTIRMASPDFYGKFGLLQTELKNSGAITELAESSSPLTNVWASGNEFQWPEKDPNLAADFNTIWITPEFGKTVNWSLKAGRDFSKDFSTDSSSRDIVGAASPRSSSPVTFAGSVIINEAAAKFMGIKDPVGAIIRNGTGSYARNYTIIGIVKDMVMQSPYETVRQTIYFMDYDNVNFIILKLNPERSISGSISQIEAIFKKLIPAAPFDYQFADKEFAAKFAAEERIGKLSTFFSVLAIFISCLGLFGLASFLAEQRTKEIGVRKVLGASVANLWGLLSKDFLFLVGISCLISTPLTWYFMQEWLQQYSYRTQIAWWIFAVTASGALLLTLVTVSLQAIRAALANPVKSLRSE